MKLFYDLETGGFNKQSDAILQFAGLIVDDDNNIVAEKDFFMQPHPLDNNPGNGALAVNHITRDMIDGFMTSAQGMETLANFLSPYVEKEPLVLAGYNSDAFDNPFLENFFIKHERDDFSSFFSTRTIDVMKMAKNYYIRQARRPLAYKQMNVAAFMGIEFDEAKLHEALYDIKVCFAIYCKLKAK